MAQVVDEYIGYVWHRVKERYVQVGASLAYTYDDCKKWFDEYKVSLFMKQYGDFDFTNYHIKMRRITYTNWEVIHD